MTASDISSIVMTVGVWQLIIDLLSNHFVYKKDPYERSMRTMERFKGKLDKAAADLKKSDKHQKKYDRAKGDYQGACADVARRHFAPNLLSSLFFIILLRILGTEHGGKVSVYGDVRVPRLLPRSRMGRNNRNKFVVSFSDFFSNYIASCDLILIHPLPCIILDEFECLYCYFHLCKRSWESCHLSRTISSRRSQVEGWTGERWMRKP